MRLSIQKTVTIGLAIAAAALLLAACGGDSDGGATAAMQSSANDLVSTRSVDGTSVLVDSQGRTLYSADVEKGGKILCTGGCTSFWDPVTASPKAAKAAAADLNLNLGDVKRPDGARQLTLDGKPLYTFTEEGAGSLSGDGFVDDFNGTRFVWSAAGADGAAADSGGSSAPSGSYPY
jgi:predicted lipoprotein with Yx(FWY)xxD motif